MKTGTHMNLWIELHPLTRIAIGSAAGFVAVLALGVVA